MEQQAFLAAVMAQVEGIQYQLKHEKAQLLRCMHVRPSLTLLLHLAFDAEAGTWRHRCVPYCSNDLQLPC